MHNVDDSFIDVFLKFISSAIKQTEDMYTARHYSRMGGNSHVFLKLYNPRQKASMNCLSSVRDQGPNTVVRTWLHQPYEWLSAPDNIILYIILTTGPITLLKTGVFLWAFFFINTNVNPVIFVHLVNIIIVSDHGMKDVTPEALRHVTIDDYVDLSLIESISEAGAFSNIKAMPGKVEEVGTVYWALINRYRESYLYLWFKEINTNLLNT